MQKPSSVQATAEIDTSDTIEFDPWEKVLNAITEQGKDIKEIKYQMLVLNTNIELVRQSQESVSRRLTLLENECPQRNGKCPMSNPPSIQKKVAALACSDSDSE